MFRNIGVNISTLPVVMKGWS